MLNSNQGRVIIGIRDDLSLVGLDSDYELLDNFDRFQRILMIHLIKLCVNLICI